MKLPSALYKIQSETGIQESSFAKTSFDTYFRQILRI